MIATKISVTFNYGNKPDCYGDFWETRGILIKDAITGDIIAEVKPDDVTYEELIVSLLKQLGFDPMSVTNNLDDWKEIPTDERHN